MSYAANSGIVITRPYEFRERPPKRAWCLREFVIPTGTGQTESVIPIHQLGIEGLAYHQVAQCLWGIDLDEIILAISGLEPKRAELIWM